MIESPRPWLVDTNVISNRGDVARDGNLAAWLRRHAARIRISVITVAEMRRGLILLEQKAARTADRKVRLRLLEGLRRKEAWQREVTTGFADRILPIDLAVAERWAEISTRFPSLRDGDKVIAATALAKGFGVATENLGDFRRVGINLVNPFDPATWDEEDGDPLDALLRN